MKQRCIFTLLINSATPYNNNHLNIKSTNNQQQNTLPLYYDLFKVLNEDRQDYATFCDSDYMCYELNDEFIEFERAIKINAFHLLLMMLFSIIKYTYVNN